MSTLIERNDPKYDYDVVNKRSLDIEIFRIEQLISSGSIDGLTWKGAYSNSISYVINDCVSYNGSSYVCILNTTGNSPTNSTYWNLLAAAGLNGTNGEALIPISDSFTNTDLVSNILTISHTFGIGPLLDQISDGNDKKLIPNDITFNNNEILIDFSEFTPITGTWNYIFAKTDVVGYFTDSNLVGNIFTIYHDMGDVTLIVGITDGDNKKMIPDDIEFFDGYIEIDFTTFSPILGIYRYSLARNGISNISIINNDLTINGTLNVENRSDFALGIRLGYINFNHYENWDPDNIAGTGDGAGITNDNGVYKALMILGNKSDGTSRRKVQLWDDAEVKGELHADSIVVRRLSGLDSEISLVEDVSDDDYGIKFKYDGGDDNLYLKGINISTESNNIFKVHRTSGEFTINRDLSIDGGSESVITIGKDDQGTGKIELVENNGIANYGVNLKYDGSINDISMNEINNGVEVDRIFNVGRDDGTFNMRRPFLYSAPKGVSNTDINNLDQTGTYKGINMTNAPDTGWWYINNYYHTSTYQTQEAIQLVDDDNITPTKYIRMKNNGVWGTWLQFITNEVSDQIQTNANMSFSVTASGWIRVFRITGNGALLNTLQFNCNITSDRQGLSGRGGGDLRFGARSNELLGWLNVGNISAGVTASNFRVYKHNVSGNDCWTLYINIIAFTTYMCDFVGFGDHNYDFSHVVEPLPTTPIYVYAGSAV